jgi:hypothetical protein
MSKVIDPNTNWFQEIAPRSFYLEDDLERTVMLNLQRIFPKFIPFMFKVDLLNGKTSLTNRADLGMIKNDYSEWYVIEVELGKHSLKDVLEQVDTFKECTYGASHVKYIFDNNPGTFDLSKLTTLIKTPPLLMVIVNEQKDDWKKPLKTYGCKMCIFQIFNDYYGERLFRLDGEHPYIYVDFCDCTYEKRVPFAIKVLKREFLDEYNVANGSSVRIDYEGKSHLWEREDDGSEVFLICKTPKSPLDELSKRYRLNYNKANTKVAKKINAWQKISYWITGRAKPQIIITDLFSFTKA